MNHTMAFDAADVAAHGWSATERPGLERMFRTAARHSRRVRVMRVAIPVTVILAVAGLMLATWLNPLRWMAKLPSGASMAISGTKIIMELPRLAGYTRDSRPYEFTAETASQDLTAPDRLEMNGIKAKMTTHEKGIVNMSAVSGTYNSKAEQLVLHERVLFSSSGYEGRLAEAVIDMKSGHVVSNKPVEVKLIDGVLTANHLEIVDSGDLMRFEGNVVLNLDSGVIASTSGAASQ
jgi:lipopolysaccharide export system protein LptC